MKNGLLLMLLMASSISLNAQKSHVFKSDDGKVLAENFISYEEGVDSVVVKNKKHQFKFSYHEPFIQIKDGDGYDLFDNAITVRNIKKVKNRIYLLVGYGGNLNIETELHLIFIKKSAVLKYYVLKSHDKTLRDVSFEYLPKTKEVVIPIAKQYTPQNFIYAIAPEAGQMDTIRPIKDEVNDQYRKYKLKVQD